MSRLLPPPHAVLGYRRDGRPIYPVLGASSEDPSNGGEPQVTLGQQQLQQMMAREKDQGSRAGRRDLVEKLGFASAAELEQWVTQQRDAEQQQLTDTQRREQDLTARETAAAQREAAAVARERSAVRRSALAGRGAVGDNLEDAVALLRLPDDADDTALDQAVTELQSRRPELFRVSTPGTSQVPPAPGGAPASVPPARPGGPAPKPGEGGLAMARRRGLLPPSS
ncbi:hypothetical protein AW27_023275 [Streptomyces sp. PCS3-D2]|uniref:hypothetical protein n=1 Tax=Streptomyces sp. PCS3-D2 TaxID=1460244 RepID=UPI00044CA10F|nr:hypothetical protein [Streptomyces sp. PCS3-D2]WKV74167.1 hypothetical protein AW27_023275 [Streptomyces sp. PCS3-D2]